MTTSNELWEKLRTGRDYRKEIVASMLKQGTALQIQGMMKQKGWTQAQLAQQAGLTQGVISRAGNPAYGNLTFNTVIDIAAGFDVAFIGKFVPFTEFTEWVERLPQGISFEIPDFDKENARLAEQERNASDSTVIKGLTQPGAFMGIGVLSSLFWDAIQEVTAPSNPIEQVNQQAGTSQLLLPLSPKATGAYETPIRGIHLVPSKPEQDEQAEKRKTHRGSRRKGFLKRASLPRLLSA